LNQAQHDSLKDARLGILLWGIVLVEHPTLEVAMPASDRPARPRTLTGRLLLWHGVAVLGVLLVLAVLLDRVLERYFVDELTESLVSQARAVQETLPPGDALEAEIVRLGRAMGSRITIIRTDGVVLADSERDPTTLENHRNRPEVRQALDGRVGVSSRPSATIGIPFRYVALPPVGSRIVRVALPLTTVQAKLRTVRAILAVGFALAALAGLLVLALIARGVLRPLRNITESVERVGQGALETSVPEGGAEEVAALARTVNEMRRDVEGRIQAVRDEQRIRDAILASLDEGVVLFGGDGGVVYRNQRADHLLGPGIDHAARLLPLELRILVERARSEGVQVSRAEVTTARDRRLQATTAALGRDGQTLLVLRDVTRDRRVEAIRREFVSNASHELKTPVASIRALAETIAGSAAGDPEAIARFVIQLEQEAIRLSRIVSDLLDLSRLEAQTGERTLVRFDEIVAEEVGRLERAAREAALSLRVNALEPAEVLGSAADLALLVRNLVENAIQYTRPGGTVEVSLSVDGDASVLTVRDDGIGIPSRDQGRIFERFYRVDRARSRATGGTGLGLSIVKHVAENHGGSVRVESELGRGSSFEVRVPVAPDRPDLRAARPSSSTLPRP
jgi:two-component system, OmpR family, phosphate regulon sensor histidine kinase PhoR